MTNKDLVYLVNAETVHAAKGDNWGGIKVQVIGRNMIPKCYSLPELLNHCQDEGLPTLLCNVGQSQESLAVAETHINSASAVITHDANNTFPRFINYVPFISKTLGKYSASSNKRAQYLIEKVGTKNWSTGVAVSSSHYLHQMGRAGIYVETMPIELTSGKSFLYSLNAVLSSHIFENKTGCNSMLDVLKFGFLLAKYGSAPNRFKGAQSSYNV